MTKDKTVTMARELAEYAAALLEQNCPGNVANEIRAAIAAPVVERQEPVARYSWRDICDMVSEVIGCEFTPDPNSFIGHQMTGINFNSLARIIDKVASPPAPVAVRITLQQVLKAYDYAESHPHKYLRGTTNWCAAVAHELNACLDKVKELNQ